MSNVDPNLDPNVYAANAPLPTAQPKQTGYTGVSEGYVPQGNLPVKSQYVGVSGAGVAKIPAYTTSVSGIVTPEGVLQNFYELNTAPKEILGSLDDIERNRLTNLLYTRGWYGNSKQQGGFGDTDEAAMKLLLHYSNVKGRTWTEILNTVEKAPIVVSGGAAPSYSSKEDLATIADKTALSTIGRKLTPEERDRFVKSYQGVQRADRPGGEQAPSADVFFQNRIQGQYGAETDAYKYLTAISNVAKLLESL